MMDVEGTPAVGAREDYNEKLTSAVIITCIMAASGGLIFGYDIGISGGVTTMKPFLEKFFPSVLAGMKQTNPNKYCVYNNQYLTLFTSSLYIAGFLSSFVAARVTQSVGRRRVMLLGGAMFFVGAANNAIAINIQMLIVGRILLGFGVGFTNQATPLYLSEVAPAKWRGAFNTGFNFVIAIGIVAANLTNYATTQIGGTWGWRLSLGLATVPAFIFFMGALLIFDSPSSLISRGDIPNARLALTAIRGVNADVEHELTHLTRSIEASRLRDAEEGPFRKILLSKPYRHHLVMAIMIPFFQQMTGINVTVFFAPVMFQTVGFGQNAALMAAVIFGAVNLVSNLVSVVLVDRFGRKALFIQGGVQMFLCQLAVATALARGYSTMAVLVLMCFYAAGFGWSWGPLSWVVPGEIFPGEIRSAGQSICVGVVLGGTFILTQTFLPMLCGFKYGIFLFYALWLALMTAFVAAFLPETKGISLESMEKVWEKHWFWRRSAK